jgi:hypothetical protein
MQKELRPEPLIQIQSVFPKPNEGFQRCAFCHFQTRTRVVKLNSKPPRS